MSTDIRALMRSLAEDAPGLDNRIALADKAFSAGRHRRRVRHALVSAAAAVATLLLLGTTLFVGPSPLAAQYGTSGGTKVSGHPTHIGHQFPVLDVPRRPGPAAGLMEATDQSWYLISPTGHRWSIPSPGRGVRYRPILSDDGRMLGYPDAEGNFVVRDLVSGKSILFGGFSPNGEPQGGRYAIDYFRPGYFSPDDNNLALRGGVSVGDGTVVLTVSSRQISAWTQGPSIGDFLAGWLDNGRLALVDRATKPWLLDVRDIRGRKVGSTQLTGTPDGGSFGWDELTTDRGSVDVVTGQTQELNSVISRYDLRDGHLLSTFTVQQPAQNCARVDSRDEVVTSTWIDGRHTSVQETTLGGTTRSVTTMSGSPYPQCVELTAAAAAGSPRSPMLLDRLTDFVAEQWTWCAVAVAALALSWRIILSRRRAGSRP